MTITTRALVDFKDIRALRLICQKCKTALSLSTDEELNLPERCPNCRTDWFVMRTTDWALMRKAFESVAELHARSADEPCVVQLEFDLPR